MILVIESGAIYSFCLIVLISLYASGSFAQYIALDATIQMIVSHPPSSILHTSLRVSKLEEFSLSCACLVDDTNDMLTLLLNRESYSLLS